MILNKSTNKQKIIILTHIKGINTNIDIIHKSGNSKQFWFTDNKLLRYKIMTYDYFSKPVNERFLTILLLKVI